MDNLFNYKIKRFSYLIINFVIKKLSFFIKKKSPGRASSGRGTLLFHLVKVIRGCLVNEIVEPVGVQKIGV